MDSGSPLDLLLIGGVAAILFSVFGFIVNRWRYQKWAKASGAIIEVIRIEPFEPGGLPTYSPRVTFRTANGEMVEFVSDVSSSPAPVIGNTVGVLYDPTDPKDAEVDRFFNKYGFAFVALGFGVIAMTIYLIKNFSR